MNRVGPSVFRHVLQQYDRWLAHARLQDARPPAPGAGAPPARARRRMSERGLLPALDRLFAGPRDSRLTLEAFLQGLETRSYAFAIAALDLPNCLPTGIPWLSTITGVPMLLLAVQYFLGRAVP